MHPCLFSAAREVRTHQVVRLPKVVVFLAIFCFVLFIFYSVRDATCPAYNCHATPWLAALRRRRRFDTLFIITRSTVFNATLTRSASSSSFPAAPAAAAQRERVESWVHCHSTRLVYDVIIVASTSTVGQTKSKEKWNSNARSKKGKYKEQWSEVDAHIETH